ncbi:MAG: Crp/Fnr family transcriptional regulator [Candidatus Nanopelagicales bacterium]
MDDALRGALLFSALDDEAAQALRASMTEHKAAKGAVIFAEGDPGDRLYVVMHGKVKLGSQADDGRENMFAVLGPGEMFGELSLFDPSPRQANAVALTDVTLLGLANESLQPWLTGRPEVAIGLLRALARRMRKTHGSLSDLVFTDVPGRVAKALIELAKKFGEHQDNGVRVNHDLTQEELAQLVGASRETVNKALADFAQRGWIVLEQKSVLILELDRLQRRAH